MFRKPQNHSEGSPLMSKVTKTGTEALANLIGVSARMNRLRGEIERAASHANASILITGETGTGKELIAGAIHAMSARAEGPFVAVNCAAISETLAESQLFGHVKGAFTGASESRRGLLEAAHGGTVLLDEIGEAPLALQAKLLRVIEGKRVRPVGATREIEIDVRFVAATNRDLEREIRLGAFRADLYYRLATIRIFAPPLREHAEDIGELARHFLGTTGMTEKAAARLSGCEWPGNVRELKSAVERMRLLTNGTITEREAELVMGTGARGGGAGKGAWRMRGELIRTTMGDLNNNVSATARVLGVDRKTVRRHLR
jgi:transcriptional regulator with PAS, ATPase and Fis domain